MALVRSFEMAALSCSTGRGYVCLLRILRKRAPLSPAIVVEPWNLIYSSATLKTSKSITTLISDQRSSIYRLAEIFMCTRLAGSTARGNKGSNSNTGHASRQDNKPKKSQKAPTKGRASKATVSEEQTEEDLPRSAEDVVDLGAFGQKMDAVLCQQRKEYADKLALRTNPAVYKNMMITVEKGTTVPLHYIGQISMKTSHTLSLNMAANPHHLPQVRKELLSSSLNINPRVDGDTIFIEMPKVTREHRESMCKTAKTICDAMKQQVRNIQSDAIKSLKAATDFVAMDDLKSMETELNKISQKAMKDLEAAMKQKQTELLAE